MPWYRCLVTNASLFNLRNEKKKEKNPIYVNKNATPPMHRFLFQPKKKNQEEKLKFCVRFFNSPVCDRSLAPEMWKTKERLQKNVIKQKKDEKNAVKQKKDKKNVK